MTSPETRIAVLEQIAESHERRITDMEDFHRDVVDRFDQKIHLDASNQIVLERTLQKAVTSLDALNDTVRNVGKNADDARTAADVAQKKADDAQKLVDKHETIARTLIRAGVFLGTVISAAWALVTFVAK